MSLHISYGDGTTIRGWGVGLRLTGFARLASSKAGEGGSGYLRGNAGGLFGLGSTVVVAEHVRP